MFFFLRVAVADCHVVFQRVVLAPQFQIEFGAAFHNVRIGAAFGDDPMIALQR